MIIFFIPTGRKRGQKNLRETAGEKQKGKISIWSHQLKYFLSWDDVTFRDGTSRQRFNLTELQMSKKTV